MAVEKSKKDLVREAAEADLLTFIKLVHPQRLLGKIHEDVISWWTRSEAKDYQLLLLPRDHMKSALIAYRVVWELTKDPTLRVLYISSTSNLAEKQLGFMKQILTSRTYKMYWPDMIHEDEGKREKWTASEISVDHPKRIEEAIRDPSIFTAGLTTSITGLHCDIAVLDDVVVKENAYTEEGREKVKGQYSLLSSIEGADAREWVVGTRYHPKDLYNDLMSMKVDVFNDMGEIVDEYDLYEKFEAAVEDVGDGTGQFLWPRQQRWDGKWFGFDQAILAQKKAKYLDRTQFRAQYYNDPNDISNAAISPEYFQYYDKTCLKREGGIWYFQGKRLNVFAAVDFAFSLKKKADYTAVVVVGVDRDHNYYILDIERFKSDKISDYFDIILKLQRKWDFRKLRAECTTAQSIIVKDLKDNYIRKHGLALAVEEFKPTRNEGSKQERIEAALQPRYANRQVWHYPGGNCEILEEELVLQNPPHDDVKDCLASVIEMAIPPSGPTHKVSPIRKINGNRFGGFA